MFKEVTMMFHAGCMMLSLAAVLVAMVPLPGTGTYAQENPYRIEEGWGTLPGGRKWGGTIGVDIDRDGNIWVFERCGGTSCTGSSLAPIIKLDPSGKVLKMFGEGMFNQPHGFHVDRDGNVWASDATGKNGKGHQVFKFSPDGKVLMTLGKAGVAGDGPVTFNRPSDVVTAPSGDIFVADGHGGANARIVKFSKDEKFIKAWGRKGSGPGEFDTPHAIAIDSQGRIFVCNRSNKRIQIFDQEGNFIAEWKQFGRPSGVFIDRNDTIYVADSQSNAKNNPGVRPGIHIGSARDGKITAFCLGPRPRRQAYQRDRRYRGGYGG